MNTIYNYQLQKWVDVENMDLVCIDSQGREVDQDALKTGYTAEGELTDATEEAS